MKKSSLPKGVVALGFVSMLMDVSSEMIHSTLPVFLVSVLGVSTLAVGIIEGIAESTASLVKIFSGSISDWMGKRKPMLYLGYGLAAVTRPLFSIADSFSTVLLARFTDRIGKGIRGAPRDALMADITPTDQLGSAYGIRQSLDTLGAVFGPLAALALMAWSHDNYRLVFRIAIIPAFLVLLIIFFFVPEPQRAAPVVKRPFPLKRSEISQLNKSFWLITALSALLTLARFSDAFLVLRADSVHLAAAYSPAVLLIMSVFSALVSIPAGKLFDQSGAYTPLLSGITFLIAANIVLALATTPAVVFGGAILWGIHMGLTQGVFSSLIADVAPAHLRGTAFGMFNLMAGIALFFASLIAGGIWHMHGASWAFWAGSVFAALSLIGFIGQRIHFDKKT